MIKKIIVNICFITGLCGNPTGPNVISGAASFQTIDNKYVITTLIDKTIIEWSDFSNSSNEIIDIDQPNTTNQVLLRVTSISPSNIAGLVRSNGKIVLVNENGISIGGSIDVQNVICSTLDVANGQFSAGLDLDFVGSSTMTVENSGNISGYEFMGIFSRHIVNSNSIHAVSSNISLAAGDAINYNPIGDVVTITPSIGVPSGIGIDNSGDIFGYTIDIKADGNLYTLAIQCSGSTFSIAGNGDPGFISFLAENGELLMLGFSSILALDDASVYLLGETVTVQDNVDINTSNQSGGGNVFIGGSFGGLDPEILNAQNTSVGPNVRINTTPEIDGNAGSVVIWADNAAIFNGSIIAQGGLLSGDGGTVEVSGVVSTSITGSFIDTYAENGTDGTVTIDPETIWVCEEPLENINTIKTSHLLELLEKNHVILKAKNAVILPKALEDINFGSRLEIKIEN